MLPDGTNPLLIQVSVGPGAQSPRYFPLHTHTSQSHLTTRLSAVHPHHTANAAHRSAKDED